MAEDGHVKRARRTNGTGGIEFLKARSYWRGYYRDAGGKLVRLPWCKNKDDAEQQLQAAREMMANSNGLSVGGVTLRSWGADFLDARELAGHRAEATDRNRWKCYVDTSHFIDWPIQAITRRDVKRWLADLKGRMTAGRGVSGTKRRKKGTAPKPVVLKRPTHPISWQTRKHALVLLRKAIDAAIDDEKVPDDFANPCIGFKVKRPPTTEQPINFLTRAEVAAVHATAGPTVRPLIEFAIATGLRQGEMCALRDDDVHLDAEVPYITVRYGGTPKKPTKGGVPRDVPLLPMALRAIKEWREVRKTWCKNNDKGLAFPAQYGGYRSKGKFLGRRHQEVWKATLKSAGVTRHLVWHDLRHTCATALLGGFFGKKWRLEEIQQLLGHSDIETTQRYAHALKETLNDAARATTGDVDEDE